MTSTGFSKPDQNGTKRHDDRGTDQDFLAGDVHTASLR